MEARELTGCKLLYQPTEFSDMSLHHNCVKIIPIFCALRQPKLGQPVCMVHYYLVSWASFPHLSFLLKLFCVECAHLYVLKNIFP